MRRQLISLVVRLFALLPVTAMAGGIKFERAEQRSVTLSSGVQIVGDVRVVSPVAMPAKITSRGGLLGWLRKPVSSLEARRMGTPAKPMKVKKRSVFQSSRVTPRLLGRNHLANRSRARSHR